ncbi:MAG TPA: PEP-utilizing enzyme [Polyangiaceae bacterium]|nr:PEP-utilizing enzyme [Polyangiaceae bacterium]
MTIVQQGEAKVAYFSVDGRGLTDIARNIALSGDPGRAYRLLADHLLGKDGGRIDARGVAIDILDGRCALQGSTASRRGMRLVWDRRSRAYQKALRRLYAGTVRIEGRWWRPKARVIEFGPADGQHALSKDDGSEVQSIAEGLERLKAFGRNRVGYFAMAGERVIEVPGPDGKPGLVIFEPTGEPPFWWKEQGSPEVALRHFEAAGLRLRLERCPRPGMDPEGDEGEDTDVGDGVGDGETLEEDRQARAEAADAMARIAQMRERPFDGRTWEEEIARIRQVVRERAGDDWMTLDLGDGQTLKVPRAPFENWALRRTSLRGLAPPWEPVARNGMKMPYDDEWHTDWWLGAGLRLEDVYDSKSAQNKAAYDAMFELQRRLGKFECAVVVGGSAVTGVVGKEVVVVPDLGPDRLPDVARARAIITQSGGKMAHLAQVMLGQNVPILRISDARERLRDGMRVTVEPEHGVVRIHTYDRS